ncbi:hypothetical protein ACWC6I_30440 [Streptomyces sp. NPDC001414]
MAGERGTLGQIVRGLSLATLIAVYLGGMAVTYRQLRVETPLANVVSAPQWAHAVLVMGLMVGGGLGVAAAIVDRRSTAASWVLIAIGTAAAVAWCLWATRDDATVQMLFAAAPPLIAFAVVAELMRQLHVHFN